MNERLLLDHIRRGEGVSRADLARVTGLSKPTVSVALANLERAGLVRSAGIRTGVPGPAAVLYELRPEAGFVLGLDVGRQFLRAAICDFTGAVRARATVKARATSPGRLAGLAELAGGLYAEVGIGPGDITQTVLGTPGVHDARRDVLDLAGSLPGWDKPLVLAELRRAFGENLMVENDVDAAALAERAHGHGREVDSFAFVSVGTGIGMGLVLNGRLHRGAHGAAGEIGYLPLGDAETTDTRDARRRGGLEAAASAAGIVRAARRNGMRGAASARHVFAAADKGDATAARVVAEEARLIAKAICSVVAVVDPELVVLGGGVGQAAGFLGAISRELRRIAPVLPELRVSALGVDAVVDGCLVAGADRAWSAVAAVLENGEEGAPGPAGKQVS
ncbi:ROK family transcriptional regulator [Actinorhabdospora filicis]|nr:ROK family transcriptional regulator [Actinorhabdospora filicis]